MSRLTKQENDVFEELRQVGDPDLDRELGALDISDCYAYVGLVHDWGLAVCAELDQIPGVTAAQKRRMRTWWQRTVALGERSLPDPMPWHELERTQQLFQTYGTDIGSALLLSALPEAYAAGWGARILAATGQLQNDQPGSLRRRIRATAQFVTAVLGPSGNICDAWPLPGSNRPNRPEPRAFHAVMGLRLFHQVIRTILITNATANPPVRKALGPENTHPNGPLNQEDLLATQLTFSVTVFEVLEKFALSWSSDDQEAYLATWTLIGKCLGIRAWDTAQWPTLDPTTVAGARRLLNLLRDRQWTEVDAFVAEPAPVAGAGTPSLSYLWDSLRPGRLLTKALLDELTTAMPERTKAWPAEAMRQLTPEVVRDRLGLGSNGLALTIVDGLPQRVVPVARFTKVSLPNPVKGRVLRMMANSVTRQTVIAFLRSSELPPFVVPGLEQLGDAIRARAR